MEIHYIKNEWKGLRFFLQMCRPITIWNHRIFLSGVPVVSKNGAACLQRGRNRRFRRKEWAVAETAARSYDRTAVSPCFLTIDCISRMRHAPNRIFLHFREKKKALQMFYLQGFSLFFCHDVLRCVGDLTLPLHTLLWLSRPFLRSAFWYTELATTSLRRISQSFWAFFWDRSMKISFNVQKFKE